MSKPRVTRSVGGLLVVLALSAGILLSCGRGREERRVVEAFYAASDAGDAAACLALAADAVKIDSWAQAINGNHLGTRHLAGKTELRQVLGGRGMCRNFYGPEGPFYVLHNLVVDGSKVDFELLPDRISSLGRPYNSYRGEFSFSDGQIDSITMVEIIGWL